MSPQKKFTVKRPARKEMLAIKREKRIKRQSVLRRRLAELTPQGWVGVGEIVGLAFLFFINLRMISPFFGKEDIANVFSAPVIPILTNFLERLMPHSYAVRLWLLVFLALFPVTFYFFVREISGRKLVGLLSGLIASLPVAIFLPLRIEFGVLGQDGAHIASLTLIPLVSLLLLRFLRRGNFLEGLFTALGTVLVALTSPIGLLVLTTFMAVITFSEMLLGRGRLKFFRFLIVILLAGGFSAFWYHPKFVILTIQSAQGQFVKKTIFNLLPVSFFLIPVLGVIGFLLFENRPQLQPMFIAFFLSFAFGLFSLGAGVVHPFPSRFLPAFGISTAFLVGFVIVGLFDFLRFSSKINKFKGLALHRKKVAFGLMGLVFILVILVYFSRSEGLWELAETQVLGLSEDHRVGIWEIKEQTTRLDSLIGYGVTGLTILIAILLRIKLKVMREPAGLRRRRK